MVDMADVTPDLQIVITPDRARSAPVRVTHPCRCDAPDPEAARMEPLEIPLAALLASGRALAICPECEYRVLALLHPP